MVNILGVDVPYSVLTVFAGIFCNLAMIVWRCGIDAVFNLDVAVPALFIGVLATAPKPWLPLMLTAVVWIAFFLQLVNALRPHR